MSGPRHDAPRSAAVKGETLERPDARSVVVRYFRIDFDRCVIMKGTRVKEERDRLCEAKREEAA